MKFFSHLKYLTAVFFVLISLGIAAAHTVLVTPGPAPFDEELLGGRYRSFANTEGDGDEVYLEIPDLGIEGNRTQRNIKWQKQNYIFFKYVPYSSENLESGKLITKIVNRGVTDTENQVYILETPSLSAALEKSINLMQISVVCGDANSVVKFKNVYLGPHFLGSFKASGPTGFNHYGWQRGEWEVRNFDFSKGFTLAGVIELSGSFGTNPENSMVEIKFGSRENRSPDCSGAYPSIAEIWPPNHDLWPVNVLGVTDPDGDDPRITITKIFQDEPVNDTGDGNTVPDAAKIRKSTAWVRAERSGNENGRVYHIYFRADDGYGGTCRGEVTVDVPKSQGQSGAAVDDGPLYNSTSRSLDFSPSHLRFTHQEVGAISDPQTVEMTNMGSRTLALQQISVWGDFTQTNDCGKTLTAGQSCFIIVNFTPTDEGFRKGGLKISTNAPDSPQFLYMVGIGGYEICPQGKGFYRDGQWFFDENENSCGGGTWIDRHVKAFGGYFEDIPLMGDWTGINNPKIGIYRHGMWYLDLNGNGEWDGCYPQGADACFGPLGGFGGDKPVNGDWNGSGNSKVGIYRHGMWYLDLNGNGRWDGCEMDACLGPFGGMGGDKPFIGDWNGDGIAKFGIYRDGMWYLDMNGNGEWDGCEEDACIGPFGGAETDQPLAGDWTGGGVSQIGFYRNGIWHLDWNGNGKWDGCDIDLCSSTFGGAVSDQPVVK
jgi:hypothetical protein